MNGLVQPVIDLSVRNLCYRPYCNHPKGCPNYGKRASCPPQSPILTDVFDLNKPVLAVWVSFNLGQHREKMQSKHPKWSLRQLDCCRWWQAKVDKWRKKEVEYNLVRYPLFENTKGLIAAYVPEAMGVNVTETMKNIGVILEWPPNKTVIKVAFVGVPVAKS